MHQFRTEPITIKRKNKVKICKFNKLVGLETKTFKKILSAQLVHYQMSF